MNWKMIQLTISGLLIAAAALFTSWTAIAEESYQFDDSGMPFMYASSDDFIWIVMDEHVSVYALDNIQKPITEYAIDAPDHIYANSNGLYVYRESDDTAQILLLDVAGKIANEWSIPSGVYIQQFIVLNDNVIAAACNHPAINQAVDSGVDTKLYQFSLTEDAGKFLAIDSIHAIAKGEQDDVLCLYEDDEGQYAVGLWSPNFEAFTDSYPLIGMEFSAILSKENGCYLLSEIGVHQFDFSTGAMTLVETMTPSMEYWRGLQRAGNKIATENFASGELVLFNANCSKESNTLRLVNFSKFNDQRINTAIQLFENRHPEMKVSFIDLDDAKLVTVLIANESGYDLLAVDDYELAVYRASGILEDLSDCSDLWDMLENWNEMPYLITEHADALPLYVLPRGYIINDKMQDLAALFPKQPDSWETFFESASNLPLLNGYSAIGGAKRFPEIYSQYLAWCTTQGTFNFDTTLFREEMLRWKEAFDAGVIVDSTETECLLLPYNIGTYPSEGCLVFFPLLNDEAIYPCQTYSIAVSRTSTQKELAKEFLTCYASVEAQRTADVNTMAAGFLKDAALYACSDPDTGYPTEMQASIYAQLLLHAVRTPYNVDFNLYAGDRIELFMENEISIDELILDLNAKYQMTLMG